MRFVIKRLKKE